MNDVTVAGFDRDLLDPKFLAGQLKKLPRDVMLTALRSGSVAVKCNALQTLQLHGKLQPEEILSIDVLLKDESPSVRSTAARSLKGAAKAEDALDALISASGDRDDRVLSDIEDVIRGFGVAIVPALVERLRVDAEIADQRILPHIASFGRPAVPHLTAAFAHDDERVRANAVAGLILLGVAILVEEQPSIQRLVDDRADSVRDLARQAMNAIYRRTRPRHMEPRPMPVVGFASKPLSDGDAKSAAKAVKVDQLIAFVHDGRAVARANVWRLFGVLGKLDTYTTALAQVALKDDEPKVRALAARALVHAPDELTQEVVHSLAKAHVKGDKHVRAAIDDTFDTLKPRTLPALIALLDERDQDVARQLIVQLTSHGDKAAKAIYEAMRAPGPVMRCGALGALTRIGGKTLDKALKDLVDMLNEPFDAARAEVVTALGGIDPKKTRKDHKLINRLKEMLNSDASLAVRLAADATLTAIGPLS